MAWCHQATSHYLSQCSPRSMLPYGVTRPQWVNSLWLSSFQLFTSILVDCFTSIDCHSTNYVMLKEVDVCDEASHGDVFCITGPLWGESASDLWGETTGWLGSPLQRTSNAELWCFVCWMPEQAIEEVVELQVIYYMSVSLQTEPVTQPL